MDQGEKKVITERIRFGMLLAVIGGFMDVYSYTVRGGVFATGQTGNFVLLALGFLRKDLPAAGRAAVPIVCFWCGIFLSQHMRHVIFAHKLHRWKQGVLCLELFLLIAVGLIPGKVVNLVPNAIISFSASMQFACFRNFGGNSAYASVFCTGNMRSCAECYYQGIVQKDRDSLQKAYGYSGILLAFFLGVLVGAYCGEKLGVRAIWVNAAFVSAAFIITMVRYRDFT